FLDLNDLKLREQMISDIASAGYTSIRIPVCFSAWTSLDTPYRWETPEGLEALDDLISWSLANGLKVIIDQHHPELDGSFPAAADIERIQWIWKQVAARYRNTDPERVLFELWNEPHDIDAALWRKHAERLIGTVREIAPAHTLIVGFHDWNSRLALIDSKPFADRNIIYTFHFYDPFMFTHQGATWSAEGLPDIEGVPFPYDKDVPIKTPKSAEGKWSGKLIETYERDSSKDKIFADLEAAKLWSESNGVPLFVGEFGSYAKFATKESRCRHFELLYTSFRKLGFPNAAWEWDGGFNMFEKGTNQVMSCVRDAAGLKETADWKLTWSDEFEGKPGTAADAGKWRHETGGKGWGNNEFQFYTDSTRNAHHDGNGFLVVKAIEEKPPGDAKCWYGECKYTSARLITKGIFAQKYGRFEARVKVPYGQGIWPAFWLLGDDIDKVGWPECGEIDVMENIGREPMHAHGTIHGPGYSGANGIGKAYKLPGNQRFTDDYHIFAVEWGPAAIRWFIDGELYHEVRPKDLPEGAKWVFDHPHFILLNLAVGGNWPGDPDDTTVFPQMMKVDFVRVYEKSGK
ncbi:MAG: cellulase family glycosylhydrolase, partial [Acidobacteriota bacterium]|nr:cellulase family glycosylhydrolase [Acidobacteriota bacterium]